LAHKKNGSEDPFLLPFDNAILLSMPVAIASMSAAFAMFPSAMSFVTASITTAFVPTTVISATVVSTAFISTATPVAMFEFPVFISSTAITLPAAIISTEMLNTIPFKVGTVMFEVIPVAEMSIPSRIGGVVIIKFYGGRVSFGFRARFGIRIDIGVVIPQCGLGHYGRRGDIYVRYGHPEPDPGADVDLCLGGACGGEASCCDHRGDHKRFHNCRFSC
jgi:hypothetical protein